MGPTDPLSVVRARALRNAILLTAATLILAALAMWASLPA